MNASPFAEDREHILNTTATLWEALRGSHIFLTGGTGFVGTWLVEAFVAANDAHNLGAHATLLTRDPERFQHQAPHLASNSAITLLSGDAASFAFPQRADFIIHAATQPSFAPDANHPTGVIEVDAKATRRVLDLAAQRSTKRLLFTSSGAVYGEGASSMPRVPENYLGAPNALSAKAAYGESKRLSEFTLVSGADIYGFETVVARLFAFVGPHLPLDAGYAVGNFMSDILDGRDVAIASDGTPYRSYLYAADMAVWLWTMLLRGEHRKAYNVGSPYGISIKELADTMVAELAPGRSVTIGRAPVDGAAPSHYVPDVEAARELGLDVRINLSNALRRTYNYYLDRRTAQTL